MKRLIRRSEPYFEAHAEISADGLYRYNLQRRWDGLAFRRVLFVMLNPSTADATKDDATIRKCVGLARNWGFGSLEVVNLFAYRATSPKELLRVADPVGPRNLESIENAIGRASAVIAAWGCKEAQEVLPGHDRHVHEFLASRCWVMCLRQNAAGNPWHPLYLPLSIQPSPYPIQPAISTV